MSETVEPWFDLDDMEMPCPCPHCGSIHELNDSRQCMRCGDLLCPNCIVDGLCLGCAEDESYEL